MKARRGTEIAARISKQFGDSIAALNLLEQQRLTVLTRSCYADREGMVFLVTTEQPAEAREALENAGYRCQTNSVLLVGPMPYRPGMAVHFCNELASHGIQVRYTYLSSETGNRCFMVFNTSDDEQALRIAQRETEMVAA